MPFHVLIAFVSAGGALSMALGTVFLRITLTRRLKKQLKPRGEYWETGTLDLGIVNTYLFAWACVLPYMQRSEFFRSLYPHLDVKAVSRWPERVAAYGVILGLLVFLLFGLILVLIEPNAR